VTLIDVPFWLSIILLQVPAAAMADRWGRKPTLMLSATALGFAAILFGLATSYWLILVSYLIWGVGFALLFGTESAFLFDSLKAIGKEDDYQRQYGRAWGLATAAALAGTLLGAPVAEATDLSTPIVMSGAFSFLAVGVAATFHEPASERKTQHHLTYGRIIGDSVDILRRRPSVRYAVMFYGLLTIGSVAPVFFFQPFLREHDIDLSAVGFWQTPARLAAVIGSVAAYRIIATFGERWTFFAMPAVIIVSFIGLGLWDSVYAQVIFPFMNFVVFLSQPTITDYLNRRVPTEQRATVVSLTNLSRSLVLIPAAPLLGLLADEASLTTSFLVGGIVTAALAVPLLAVWSPLLLREEAPPLAPEAAVARAD
jgi:MFS family permease